MKDILGRALTEHFHRQSPGKLWVHNYLAQEARSIHREQMPLDFYFRDINDMPDLEWVALQQCRGKILDVGAGAGSHALTLQLMSQDVTALDVSPLSAALMEHRGITKVIRQDFFELRSGAFDTLLLLMNGIGLAGSIDGLRTFLAKAKKLLRPGGQLVFDSSDVAYLYPGKTPLKGDPYYGEVFFRYEYKQQLSDWFPWLFIDRKTLTTIVAGEAWHIEVLSDDGKGQYLVKCHPA
jgi:SAM-dependent methyltransferase